MKVGVYQNHPEFGKKEKNTDQAIEVISRVDTDLMVLPELFNTGYQFISREEVMDLAEEIPDGETCSRLSAFARSRNTYIVFGLAEKDGKNLFNSAVMIGPEGFIGRYRKSHLFFEEKEWFVPGDTGYRIFDIGMAKIGIMICFDWQFPEAARVLALLGADIICHPSNLVLPFCQDAMITRSLENGVYTITSNRVGTEKRGGKAPLVFTGRSQIVGTGGEVLARMKENETGTEVREIDPLKARDKTVTRFNDRIIDRKPEHYVRLIKK